MEREREREREREWEREGERERERRLGKIQNVQIKISSNVFEIS